MVHTQGVQYASCDAEEEQQVPRVLLLLASLDNIRKDVNAQGWRYGSSLVADRLLGYQYYLPALRRNVLFLVVADLLKSYRLRLLGQNFFVVNFNGAVQVIIRTVRLRLQPKNGSGWFDFVALMTGLEYGISHCKKQCCGAGPFLVGSLLLKSIRHRLRLTEKSAPAPDKKTQLRAAPDRLATLAKKEREMNLPEDNNKQKIQKMNRGNDQKKFKKSPIMKTANSLPHMYYH